MHEKVLAHGIRLMLVFTVWTSTPDAAVGQISLGVPVNYAVGVSPGAVVTGDFNNDGQLDLAVANTGSNNVSILIGNGDGTFQPAVNYSVGLDPVSIAIVDLNGDHNQDLAISFHGDVSSQHLGGVSLLVGNGDGTFKTISALVSSDYPQAIVTGDFDADGKPDVAIANLDASVSVFRGNGDGTFSSADNYAVTGDPESIVIGDFDADGKQDLLVTTGYIVAGEEYRGKASVLLGNGNGSFQAAIETDLGGAGRSGVVADFNRDHILDLAFLTRSDVFAPFEMAIGLGQGRGTFATARLVNSPGLVSSLTVDDINADGYPDLVALSSQFAPAARLFLGHGDGTFQLAQTVPFHNSVPNALAIGDFNGDQLQDFAITMGPQNVVSILMNRTTDFRIFASEITPAIMSPGQSASSGVSSVAANGFSGPISLTCSVQPAPPLAPQCSISPSSVNPGAAATLTVTTSGPSAALHLSGHRFETIVAWLPLLGAVLFWIPRPNRRYGKRSASWVILISLSLTLAFQVACGGASGNIGSSGSGRSETPSGKYAIIIKGTSGATEHSTSVDLFVQ